MQGPFRNFRIPQFRKPEDRPCRCHQFHHWQCHGESTHRIMRICQGPRAPLDWECHQDGILQTWGDIPTKRGTFWMHEHLSSNLGVRMIFVRSRCGHSLSFAHVARMFVDTWLPWKARPSKPPKLQLSCRHHEWYRMVPPVVSCFIIPFSYSHMPPINPYWSYKPT